MSTLELGLVEDWCICQSYFEQRHNRGSWLSKKLQSISLPIQELVHTIQLRRLTTHQRAAYDALIAQNVQQFQPQLDVLMMDPAEMRESGQIILYPAQMSLICQAMRRSARSFTLDQVGLWDKASKLPSDKKNNQKVINDLMNLLIIHSVNDPDGGIRYRFTYSNEALNQLLADSVNFWPCP